MSFIGAIASFEEAKTVILGLPYDGTVSYRPGTRFGPPAIREVCDVIETYSPYLDLDMEDYLIHDAGDLEFPFGNREKTLKIIEDASSDIINQNKKLISLGGEHLVTYPVIRAYHEKYPDLKIIHLDAHADLRDDYMGEKLSHATVMRRCSELVGLDNIYSSGIRSGTRDEFALKKPMSKNEIIKTIENLEGPVYLTLDLDALDPSVFPGTGTPEAGGYSYNELMEIVYSLRGKNLVGADLVELSPPFDPQGNSSIVVAKILREVALIISE